MKINRKNQKKVNRKQYIEIFFGLFLLFFLSSIVIFNISEIKNTERIIFVFSWISIFVFLLILRSIKNVLGSYFNLYTCFFIFLFIFSFGQFIMWAFGIHYISELGVSQHVRFIDYQTIIKVQIISLELICVFHIGALISYRKFDFTHRKIAGYQKSMMNIISLPLIFITSCISIYYSWVGFSMAKVSGYDALFEITMPIGVKYISYMFVPSLIMRLISKNYAKSTYIRLSIIFFLYALPLLVTGDRGSWIYFLGPWIFCYIKLVPKDKIINKQENENPISKFKLIIIGLLIGGILLGAAAFVSVRGVGYTELSKSALSDNILYLAFVKPVFEMGQSARILGIVIMDGLDSSWNYGNTFIADILGMIFPSIKVFFGYPSFYVENWMSSSYLNMENYGVGFSTFAEAYLNGGLWLSWVYVAIFGYVIGRMTFINVKYPLNYPLRMFFAFSCVVVLGPSVRATLDLWLREFFWGTILFSIVIYSYSNIKYHQRK